MPGVDLKSGRLSFLCQASISSLEGSLFHVRRGPKVLKVLFYVRRGPQVLKVLFLCQAWTSTLEGSLFVAIEGRLVKCPAWTFSLGGSFFCHLKAVS